MDLRMNYRLRWLPTMLALGATASAAGLIVAASGGWAIVAMFVTAIMALITAKLWTATRDAIASHKIDQQETT